MDDQAVKDMLAQDLAEWARLAAVLDAHPSEILHKAGTPPWTSRDIYAHLARWLVYSDTDMESHLAGGPVRPPVNDPDEVNARWQREDSVLTLDEARARAEEAFETRLRIIQSIRTDEWDDTLDRICRYDGAAHVAMHRGYISLA